MISACEKQQCGSQAGNRTTCKSQSPKKCDIMQRRNHCVPWDNVLESGLCIRSARTILPPSCPSAARESLWGISQPPEHRRHCGGNSVHCTPPASRRARVCGRCPWRDPTMSGHPSVRACGYPSCQNGRGARSMCMVGSRETTPAGMPGPATSKGTRMSSSYSCRLSNASPNCPRWYPLSLLKMKYVLSD